MVSGQYAMQIHSFTDLLTYLWVSQPG